MLLNDSSRRSIAGMMIGGGSIFALAALVFWVPMNPKTLIRYLLILVYGGTGVVRSEEWFVLYAIPVGLLVEENIGKEKIVTMKDSHIVISGKILISMQDLPVVSDESKSISELGKSSDKHSPTSVRIFARWKGKAGMPVEIMIGENAFHPISGVVVEGDRYRELSVDEIEEIVEVLPRKIATDFKTLLKIRRGE
jgi:hypothetical protein